MFLLQRATGANNSQDNILTCKGSPVYCLPHIAPPKLIMKDSFIMTNLRVFVKLFLREENLAAAWALEVFLLCSHLIFHLRRP
jgi:hypothetical protein